MRYIKHTLDRADHLRKDNKQLTDLFNHEKARFYPISDGAAWIDTANPGAAITLSKPTTLTLEETVFLGFNDGNACFAFSCTYHSEEERGLLTNESPHTAQFCDLRTVSHMLDHNEGSLLAYAKALIGWQESVRFCELCGSPLRSISGGHVKKCTNNDCTSLQFPRTDPAVIMLVEQPATANAPARCLLGRNANWPEGVFSTLAGFVEPGESLEHAVIREVYEESHIKVSNVRYLASQPWPFPRSIMLGFIATAETDKITCDPTELEDARWFTKDEMQTFGDWGDETPGLKLPRRDSISRYLINHWLDSV